MSTVAQVIDRLYREYLYPASNQPSRALLNGALDNSTTTVPLTTGILTPEEVDLIGEGVVVEIGQEQMLVTAYTDPNATVVRAWNGTDAATHSDGDAVYLAPMFGRRQVFDSVADAVVDLYPELYSVKEQVYPTAVGPVDIDANAVEVQSYTYKDSGRLYRAEVAFFDDFGNPKIQFGAGVPSGKQGYLTYFAKFPRPTAETDDLGDTDDAWAIPEEMVRIILVDAFASLVASRQGDGLSVDFIVELLQREGFDTRDSRQVLGGLIGLRAEWVSRAQRRQRQTTPLRVEMVRK